MIRLEAPLSIITRYILLTKKPLNCLQPSWFRFVNFFTSFAMQSKNFQIQISLTMSYKKKTIPQKVFRLNVSHNWFVSDSLKIVYLVCDIFNFISSFLLEILLRFLSEALFGFPPDIFSKPESFWNCLVPRYFHWISSRRTFEILQGALSSISPRHSPGLFWEFALESLSKFLLRFLHKFLLRFLTMCLLEQLKSSFWDFS